MPAGADGFRTALELHELGVRLQREKLRREHPGATAEEVERLVVAWLNQRDGAEHGDGVGRPR